MQNIKSAQGNKMETAQHALAALAARPMSKYRVSDRVMVDATDEAYSSIDGLSCRVAVVGPRKSNPCHAAVPADYLLLEHSTCAEEVSLYVVRSDQVRFAL